VKDFVKNSAVVVDYKSKQFKELDKETNGQLSAACDFEKLHEQDEGMLEISYPTGLSVKYVLVVKHSHFESKFYRDFGGRCFTKYNGKVDHLYFRMSNVKDIKEGAFLASYTFTQYKVVTDTSTTLVIDGEEDGITSIYESIFLARDLVTEPGNKLYPESYADRICKELEPLGVRVKVLHERQLRALGFDLLLSVGEGSERDSYVVVMEWNNAVPAGAPLALVGKGVTFDSGGISLKPGKGMGDMKTDMGGSAAVVGAMHAIASKKIKCNVVGIVGLVENMPDGKATRPGDVLGSLDGQTVENLNTDAEGRLVLADILTFIQREHKPSHIIDLATLTGAIVGTLGHEAAGLFSNSTEFADNIKKAGMEAGENYFRMPMGKNWNKMINSPIADMQNIGGPYGGSSTAAEFLYRFVDIETPWSHLDIAGMAWADSAQDTTPKGAVGFGVRTLYNIARDMPTTNIIDDDMKY